MPIWIMKDIFRPNQVPVVNVAAAVLVLASTIPVYLTRRLSGDDAIGRRRWEGSAPTSMLTRGSWRYWLTWTSADSRREPR
ncbi:hypothetical protein [Haloechinothrix halophila]